MLLFEIVRLDRTVKIKTVYWYIGLAFFGLALDSFIDLLYSFLKSCFIPVENINDSQNYINTISDLNLDKTDLQENLNENEYQKLKKNERYLTFRSAALCLLIVSACCWICTGGKM
jgi:hypothetical protein